MSLNSAKSLNSNIPFSTGRVIKTLDSVSFLQTDYETVLLTDGTQIQRERQTKAQAKIQALKIKHRNENLRRRLMSISSELKNTKQEFNAHIHIEAATNTSIEDSTIIVSSKHQNSIDNTDCLEEVSTLNEISAIQKQIIAKSEKLAESHESNCLEEAHAKSTESKLLNLKKIIFG